MIMITFTLTLGCATEPSKAASPHAAAKSLLEGFIADRNTPGLQYAIFDAHNSLFEFNGGLADIKNGKSMTPETTLMAYSMTKTITAATVLILAHERLIDLEAPIQEYLPDFPYGDKVLVRHLLSQTSGLPNPIPLRWVHLAGMHERFNEKSALEHVATENPDLSFAPGEKYAYSNLSYWYLGQLISRVSGISYQEVLKRKLFTPLEISENEMNFVISNVPWHSKGYLKKWSFMNFLKGFLTDSKFFGEYEDGWLEVLPHYPNGPAFGGIIGSAAGFKKFLQDQLQARSRLLGSDTKDLFYSQQQSNRGEAVAMTLGWHIDELDGIRYFYKEGGGAGYHSEMRIYPSKGTGSVILTNSTGFNTRKSLSRVDALFLKGR